MNLQMPSRAQNCADAVVHQRAHIPPARIRRAPCTARYQKHDQLGADLLASLVEQSRQLPVVVLPEAARLLQPQLSAVQPHAASNEAGTGEHGHDQRACSSSDDSITPYSTNSAQQQQQQQQQQPNLLLPMHLPQRKLRPSQMDFETTYQQLDQWKSMYLSAHVPRFCFDAPELGGWVRHMRKQHKEGLLEQWKVERLNLLQFEWELTDQDAKWHHKFHQLRRHQLLYGTTQVDPSHSSTDHCDWKMIVRWLNKQARLLAKRKLSRHKQAMLQQLGVTLLLPKRLVHRTAQLQALNGMERRKLRKKWKKLDVQGAEQQRQQRWMGWEQRRQQQRQQQWVANRRAALLSSVQVGPDGGITPGLRDQAAVQLQQQQQQQQAQLGQGPLAPWQQQKRNEELQQQQLQEAPAMAALAGPADAMGGSGSSDSSSSAHVWNVHFADRGSQAGSTGLLEGAQQQHQQLLQQAQEHQVTLPEQQQAQQQQQQQALFWQRNRRGRKGQQKTRQEKWLSAQQAGPSAY